MNFCNVLNKSEPHLRTIIHLDMDCFYAQVEEIRDASLRSQPLGVQQKNIVVTCNYQAREYGVTKLMLITEAKRLCPQLVLVNGEDLSPYRQMSQRVFELLSTYTPTVEKLGFDENFMDVSRLVEMRRDRAVDPVEVEGHIYPADDRRRFHACPCGCAERLAIGSHIAREIRDDLYGQLGLTCCAGVSYNKLLAKLVGSKNKPNQQTVLASMFTEQFMRELNDLSHVTGIGQKTESLLLENGIATVEQLQNCDMDVLRKKFGFETATKLKDLAFGRDVNAVRPSGKPKSIGLEDSCRPISVFTDVEDRFRLLLMRLVEQVAEDGRFPIAIKIIVRKYDQQKKTSHRETKQINILPSLFKSTSCSDSNGGTRVVLAEGSQEKLLKIIMRLFERVVDLRKPFNITLLGLAFSKFQQRKAGSASIANFLIKKADLEVQSITSLTNPSVNGAEGENSSSVGSSGNDEHFRLSPTTFQPSDQFYRRRAATASPIPMLVDNGSESGATNSDFSDFSETEVEPSPKKSRMGRLLLNKRRCFCNSGVYEAEAVDVASPSKLRVCDLRLSSRDSEKDIAAGSSTGSSIRTTTPSAPSAERDRTGQPPPSLLNRMDECLPPPHLLLQQISSTPLSISSQPIEESLGNVPTSTPGPKPTLHTFSPTTANRGDHHRAEHSNIPYPSTVDPSVFNALPVEVQNELIASWRSSLAAAAAAVANGQHLPVASGTVPPKAKMSASKVSGGSIGGGVGGGEGGGPVGSQKNTLYRYFLRNK